MSAQRMFADEVSPIATDVRRGLTARPKTLPARLFYDDEGSRLYELITDLPEYYLTRAERRLIVASAADIAARVGRPGGHLSVIELGAGSASKTAVLLAAMTPRQSRCLYVPIDVSRAALAFARENIARAVPGVEQRPLPGTYDDALRALGDVPAPRVVLFLGSSVGNMTDPEASALFARVRRSLPRETRLLVGTDLRKDPSIMRPAYDDAAGVTAAFNKNVLVRINRELGGRFVLDRFRHVARWNAVASCIEMHLESVVAQEVAIDALRLRVGFDAGETIHTESCAKYDPARVDRILAAAGFALETRYVDRESEFALHLAVATEPEKGL